MALNLEISRLKLKGHSRKTPHLEFHKTLQSVHIGDAEMALQFAHYMVCHFGATYMNGMTGDPLFILDI